MKLIMSSQWSKVGIGVGGGAMVLVSACFLCNYWKKKSAINIIIFTRYPTPGATKTRLFPALGPKGAAWTQRYMSEHMFGILRELKDQDPETAHITVEYSGAIEPQITRWLARPFQKTDVTWRQQLPGPCLGDKLVHAFKRSFDDKYEYTIIIGSDIPDISVSLLQEAIKSLQPGSRNDVVLGKAEDGGYYLIGVRTSCKPIVEELFKSIKWGTEEVFQQQAVACRRLDLKLHVLSQVLNDVDLPEDLPVFEKAVGVPASELRQPRWSVVIPTLNEAENMLYTLQELLKSASSTDNIAEVIISDGGSSDDTVKVAQAFAKTSPVPIKIVSSRPGRGIQQHTGASHATGSRLLFLHADTKLPQDFDILGAEALAVPGNVAAAFMLDFDGLHPEHRKSRGLPVLNWFTYFQLRLVLAFAKLSISFLPEAPYGDQSLMLTCKSYNQVGGFDSVKLLDDFIMVRKLQKIGHVVTLPESVITSSRRQEKKGPLMSTFINRLIVTLYSIGVSTETLAQFYYGKKLKKD